ncbi:MAG: SAM-dependent chlorinase/fluorinase [Gammaproteobacteria bacterium]|jgi:S-adenosylmethionine hydrolase
MPQPIAFLFTDFGPAGPYMGQLQAALSGAAPTARVITLQSDAPAGRPRPAGYLLAALLDELPADCAVLAVVDPGVGTARRPLVVRADGRWLVGPDNGLLAPAVRRAKQVDAWRIDWRPARLSASFHGRDLFAPVCGGLLAGAPPPGAALDPRELVGADWPADCAEIVYLDHFGNAMSGLRGSAVPSGAGLACGPHRLRPARVFGEVPAGEAFWYVNSCGLVEIAVNGGSAGQVLGLAVGDPVAVTGG